jgi:hypothetical protein
MSSDFPFDSASADIQARIQKGQANGFARVAVEVKAADFRLECERFAVQSSGWIARYQRHERTPLSPSKS